MMRLIDRHIIYELIQNFILAALALTFMFFIAEYLHGVFNEEASVIVLLKYKLYFVPSFFCQMTPPSAMVATMVTLSSLNRRNELTAIQGAGIGLGHIAFLVFGVVFIASCITLTIHDRIIPPLAHKRTIYYWKTIKGRTDFSLDIKASKIWYRSKNHIYNFKLYDKISSTIQGIGVFFFDDSFHLIQHVEAQTAQYDTDKGSWHLKNGMLTIFPENDAFPMSKHFQEKRLQLPEKPQDFLEIERQVDSLRLKELLKFISRNKEAGLDTKAYEVDFHSRIAVSFVALVMALLAIPYCVRPHRQGGLAKDLVICGGWIFTYWLLFSLSLSLGKSGVFAPWLAVWTLPTLFLGAAIMLIVQYRAI